MTYEEYKAIAGHYDPTAHFALIPALNTVTFETLFNNRFNKREIYCETATEFTARFENYAAVICSHYSKLIAAYNEAAGDTIGNLTRETTTYAAPLGEVDTAFAVGSVGEVIKNDKNDVKKLTDYLNDIIMIYNDLLRAFEPLFVGVL